MNWSDTGYEYLIEVAVVSQTNVDEVLGYLSGVGLDGASITENYYSDSRIQAKISTIVEDGASDGYVNNARLRIVLLIPSRNWSEELVTGYVSDIQEQTEHGRTKRTYTIEGTIWGLLEHKVSSSITIGEGANLVTTWKSLMSQLTKMQYTTAKSQDHTFTSVTVYEAGTLLSTILFEVSSGYDRIETTGHGVVSLEKYEAPAKKEPDRYIDFSDASTLSLYPLERTSNVWDAPGRAIVTANVSKTDENGTTTPEVLVGVYDAPSSHQTSMATRGWLKARSDSYSGTSETPTKDELNAVARKNWEEDQDKGYTWSCGSVFADYHAGQIAMLISPMAKEGKKVLIQSVNTRLDSFTQDLTLKEV